MEHREELVGKSVEEAKRIAREVGELARTQARLGVEEARAAIAPAEPALRDGAFAVALGIVGGGVLLLPALSTLARRRALCLGCGAVMVASAFAIGRRALASVPPDVRARLRNVLRSDLATAVDAAIPASDGAGPVAP